MKLLRLDLTHRHFIQDFELFEIGSANLSEFAEMLYEQEIEYITETCGPDDAEILDRSEVVEYYVGDTYVEFTYDGGFESRFYLVDNGYNIALLQAANSEIIHNTVGLPILNSVFQKKLQQS